MTAQIAFNVSHGPGASRGVRLDSVLLPVKEPAVCRVPMRLHQVRRGLRRQREGSGPRRSRSCCAGAGGRAEIAAAGAVHHCHLAPLVGTDVRLVGCYSNGHLDAIFPQNRCGTKGVRRETEFYFKGTFATRHGHFGPLTPRG